MKRHPLVILFYISLSMILRAQSGIKLTDYYNNPIQYNPAYVGVTNGYLVKGTYTSQWLGFDNSPVTQTIDFNRRFLDNRYAAGISAINDDFGAVKNFNLEGNFALHLNLSENLGMVLGLKTGINNFSINYDRLTIFNPTEDVYNYGNLNDSKILVGGGIYLYTKQWFFGFSVPNLLNNRMLDISEIKFYNKRPHFYTVIGYDLRINSGVYLKSQILTQIVNGAPLSILFSTKAKIKDRLGIGIHYQNKSLLGVFLNININRVLVFSYGYDMAISDLSQYSNGNNYFGLSYKFGQDQECDCKNDDSSYDRIYLVD